jgi:hypothetical protein
VAVALKAVLDELAELVGKGDRIKEVMYAQARARRLARVSWADALLRGPDAG